MKKGIIFAISALFLIPLMATDAFAEVVFYEDFDGTPPNQFAAAVPVEVGTTDDTVFACDHTLTAIFGSSPGVDNPPSSPNWGVIQLDAGGATPAPTTVTCSVDFTVVTPGVHDISGVIGAHPCNGCNEEARVYVDGVLELQFIGDNLASPAGDGEPQDGLVTQEFTREVLTNPLTAGTHTIAIEFHLPTGTGSGSFFAYFDNLLIQSSAPTYNFNSIISHGPFIQPSGVAVDDAGNIFVVDLVSGKVGKFDSAGNHLLTSTPTMAGPRNLAIHPDGTIYVPDFGNGHLTPLNNDATLSAQAVLDTPGFTNPHSVAIAPNGDFWVSDEGQHNVQKFNSARVHLFSIGSLGTGDGQFDGPVGLAVDSNGNLYVAEVNNHRIQKFDSDGNFLTKIGVGGTAEGQFTTPTDVAVDSFDNIYVADLNNHRVQIFNSNLQHLDTLGAGGQGSGEGQFAHPHGVHVSGGFLFVAEHSNSRVQVFSTGELVGSLAIDGVCEIDMASASLAFNPGNPIDHGLGSEGTGEISEVISNTLGNLNSDTSVSGSHWTNPTKTLTIMDVSHTRVSTTQGEAFTDMTSLSTSPLNLGAIAPQSSLTTYWNVQVVMDGGNPGYSGATVQEITLDFACTAP